jgi:hypothetical protein
MGDHQLSSNPSHYTIFVPVRLNSADSLCSRLVYARTVPREEVYFPTGENTSPPFQSNYARSFRHQKPHYNNKTYLTSQSPPYIPSPFPFPSILPHLQYPPQSPLIKSNNLNNAPFSTLHPSPSFFALLNPCANQSLIVSGSTSLKFCWLIITYACAHSVVLSEGSGRGFVEQELHCGSTGRSGERLDGGSEQHGGGPRRSGRWEGEGIVLLVLERSVVGVR